MNASPDRARITGVSKTRPDFRPTFTTKLNGPTPARAILRVSLFRVALSTLRNPRFTCPAMLPTVPPWQRFPQQLRAQ